MLSLNMQFKIALIESVISGLSALVIYEVPKFAKCVLLSHVINL